jgi:hypothetical protein
MIGVLIHVLILLLVLGIVWIILEWAVGQLPLPAPIPQVVRVMFVIVVLIILLYAILPMLVGPAYLR